MEDIIVSTYQSPVGEMILGAFEGRLCLCDWAEGRQRKRIDMRTRRMLSSRCRNGQSEVIDKAGAWLDHYFSGGRSDFPLPILLTGSDFQKRVWSELMHVAYGTTTTYSVLARSIGRPEAVRAVASAVATNPISVFVPCHRVIGADGTLTGYNGGLDAKRFLLDLERTYSQQYTINQP